MLQSGQTVPWENLEGRISILYQRKRKTRKKNFFWLLSAPFDKIHRKEMNSEKNSSVCQQKYKGIKRVHKLKYYWVGRSCFSTRKRWKQEILYSKGWLKPRFAARIKSLDDYHTYCLRSLNEWMGLRLKVQLRVLTLVTSLNWKKMALPQSPKAQASLETEFRETCEPESREIQQI